MEPLAAVLRLQSCEVRADNGRSTLPLNWLGASRGDSGRYNSSMLPCFAMPTFFFALGEAALLFLGVPVPMKSSKLILFLELGACASGAVRASCVALSSRGLCGPSAPFIW